jgi:S1-C subfamily serine protease
MNRLVRVFILTMGVLACALCAQAQMIQVTLRIVLVDRDLNQKAVPSFRVTLERAESPGAEAIELKTALDGTCQKSLPSGKYKLTSLQPIEFQGKRYSWSMDVTLSGAQQVIELTNDNAKAEALITEIKSPPGSGASNDLNVLFEKLKNSVVKVRAEGRDGSGFIVDPSGLVVTNNHVVESSGYVAVQFDQKRKVLAKVLATDTDKDIAVLWTNLKSFPEATVASLVPSDMASQLVVGERVFTIGCPLGREKVLTTGVVSKVETKAITSDININPGNSGGPLFNLRGEATGITRAGLRLLASIVPIAEVRPVIEQARQKMAGASAPSADLLPVEPTDFFPSDALVSLLQRPEKMDTKPYFFPAGQFEVGVLTPYVRYYLSHRDEMDAARKAAKRSGTDPSQTKPPAEAVEEAQDFAPVLLVRVAPKFSVMWKVKFKNGFQKMRLLCGGKEIPPIDPGRSEYELHDARNRVVDTTMQGFYSYPPDAISPTCGSVNLEIYSEKDPNTPITQPVETVTVERVWSDFEPYRKGKKD